MVKDYRISLRSDEPCDIYLVASKGTLSCVVVESTIAYAEKLDSISESEEFILVCSKHGFAHRDLVVTVVDDFALIDGSACFAANLDFRLKEVLDHAISGS